MSKLVGKEVSLLTAVSYGGIVRKKLRTRLPYNTILEWNIDKDITLVYRLDF